MKLLHRYAMVGALLSLHAGAAAFYPGFGSRFAVYTNDLPAASEYSGWLALKCVNGSGVLLTSGPQLFTTPVPAWQPQVMALATLLRDHHVQNAARAFSRPAAELDAERGQGNVRGSAPLSDLNLWFLLAVPDYTTARALLVPLFTNPVVELVYMHPVAPPLPTTNLIGAQGYLLPSMSNGYDARYAWTQPGGDGAQVRLVDIEYDWCLDHEDLKLSPTNLLGGVMTNLYGVSRDHGTASLGISAARSNSYGMCGIVYNADFKVISCVDADGSWLVQDAINLAVSNTQPGDVILLEQQAYANGDYCPVEYWALIYAAIANATALDRIVIEPAGNGNADLDNAVWGGIFQRSYRDSLAIMVGAGTATGRARCSFSGYGSRLDIQGWGDWTVASLGYGDLCGTQPTNQYTRTFAGTSSASALSAGVAASVQSYARATYGLYLPPLTLRSNLVQNGQAQTFGLAGVIGPRPNLRASYQAVVPEPGCLIFWLLVSATAKRYTARKE
ncbi:MAG: S8 family serine peptidase [bacterium]|nr:S8 family serine peptidase [bacterium]